MNTSLTTLSPRALALRAQTELIVDKDLTAFDRYWAEPYLQHNPTLPSGMAAIRGFMAQVIPFANVEILRVVADGDMVAFHQRVTLPGTKLAVFDLYRVDDGKLVEHWDAMQPDEVAPPGTPTPFDGTVALGEGDAEATRAVVASFVDAVLIAGEPGNVGDRVTPDLVRHGVGLADGSAGLADDLAQLTAVGDSYLRCVRILAEADFALSVCEARIGDGTVAVYDLWRVTHGRIAEQWRVTQRVPATTVSGLSVF
jgi:predicted SnoaL-like aldol condensation-catalyzing enzyme